MNLLKGALVVVVIVSIVTSIHAALLDSLFSRGQKSGAAKDAAAASHGWQHGSADRPVNDESVVGSDPVKTFERITSVSLPGRREEDPVGSVEYSEHRTTEGPGGDIHRDYRAATRDGTRTVSRDETNVGKLSNSGLENTIRGVRNSVVDGSAGTRDQGAQHSKTTPELHSDSTWSEHRAGSIRNSDDSTSPEIDALKKRIEDAMASLTTVYDSLLHREQVSGAASSEIDGVDVSHMDSVRASELHVDSEMLDTVAESSHVLSAGATNERDSNVSHETGWSGGGSQVTSAGGPRGSTETGLAERAAAPSNVPQQEEQKDKTEGTESNARSLLTLLAGGAFVAAIGLMAAGLVHNRREQSRQDNAPGPYPPSGPSFV